MIIELFKKLLNELPSSFDLKTSAEIEIQIFKIAKERGLIE